MGKKITCFSIYKYARIINDSQDIRTVCSAITLAIGQVSANKLTSHEFSAVLSMAASKINKF